MTEYEYRTPEETRAAERHNTAVQKVLDQAVHDGASLAVAIRLGEPPDVVEQWVNRLWDGLRDNLAEKPRHEGGLLIEDRLTAIVLAIQQRTDAEADALLSALKDETP